MIRTVLIANRGEIALRVMRCCRRLGVRSVAVFTDLDETAPHVRAADDAVRIGSYLDIEAVVAAARETGAEAIHPGYGFLSERAELARAVEDAGLVLVGPSARVMDQMGRKDHAREVAVSAGVAVLPVVRVTGRVSSSPEIDFPVLVKAAAGGGGKGMRVVRQESELAEAMSSAAREAASAFGDDTLLVEKYVESGRHIEVQILADSRGNVVHLFERDCSTQRRHQKVLEEAPAPTITAEQRAEVTGAAVALAREVGYENAGTVEFLLDNATGRTYFLEMNTRLQVEHPVTELAVSVGGDPLDLVELQLRVAAGEELSFTQDDVTLSGHAIEARVYAEDSFDGFLPQAGTARLVRWPEHARVDAALEEGQQVSTAYDPMLGKVIVRGPDRESARRALVAALDDIAIVGLTTNAGFLRTIVASEQFRDATVDTAWLDTAEIEPPRAEVARIFAAWTSAREVAKADDGPFRSDGFRLGAAPAPVLVQLDEPVYVDRLHGRVGETAVRELSAESPVVALLLDGRRERAVVDLRPHAVEVVHRGQRFVFERPDIFAARHATAGEGTLTAPMPGTLLAVDVAEGEAVTRGQRLGVLEAMKMELALKAPFDGTVSRVGATIGAQVTLGQVLFEVEGSVDDDGDGEDAGQQR